MDPSAAILSVLEYIILFACLFTSIRLAYNGLFRRYRALFAYLVFRFFYTFSLLFIFRDLRSPAYARFWYITEPIIWFFYAIIVVELYSLILERHKGLYTLGKWALYAGMAIAILISGLALLPQWRRPGSQASRILREYFAIERGVDLSLFLFLIFILLWLTRYPVPLSRNVVVHSVVYSILFLSNTAGVLLLTVLGQEVHGYTNTFLLGIGAVCILIWLFCLTPKGEEVRLNLPKFGPEHEERILSQLEALNKTLLKVSRD